MDKHLVLVGGGHAHLAALKLLGAYIERGCRVTLISSTPYQYYSGMGPGMLSGIYKPSEARFNVRKMAEDGGAAFIEGRVTSVEPKSRTLLLDDGESVCYDVASFNTGSEVIMEIPTGGDRSVIPVKPVHNLYLARCSILAEFRDRELGIVVIGGGPSAVEVAANAWRLLRDHSIAGRITLVARRQLLGDAAPARVRRLALRSLAKNGIRVVEGVQVESVENKTAALADGSVLPFDYAFLAPGVKPSGLFRDSGIPTSEDGSMFVNDHLQSVTHPAIFGGGDCVCPVGHRISKLGVYAVRQCSILHRNLMAALEGGPLEVFDPGGSPMLILNMGDGKGILWKNNWVWSGRFAFLLKDRIDRRFMRKFQVSGELDENLPLG